MTRARRTRRRRRNTSSTVPTQSANLWRPEWEILAFLDYCRLTCNLTKPAYEHFKQTIESHLWQSIKKHWSFHVVDRRLQQLWQQHRDSNHAECGHEYVYSYGSSILSSVGPDLMDQIRERTAEIKDGYAYQRFGRPRTTRSKHLGNHISLGLDFPDGPRRTVKKLVVQVPVDQPREKGIHGEVDPETILSTDDVFHDAPSSYASPMASSIPDTDDNAEILLGEASSPAYSTDGKMSEDFLITIEDEVATEADTDKVELFASNATHITDSDDQSSHQTEAAQYSQRDAADWRKQAEFYLQEWNLSNEHIADLERRLDASEEAIQLLKRSDEVSIMKDLIKTRSEAEMLRSKLDESRALGEFTKTRYKYPLRPIRKEIEQDTAHIVHRLMVLALSETTSDCGEASFGGMSEDLLDLCYEAFGKSTTVLSGTSLQSVLCALTSVAICKWIFETDLDEPYFAKGIRGDTMLKHVATQDGEDVARNIDAAVLTTLTEQDYCQKVLVPEQARVLTERLSTALTPLIETYGIKSEPPADLQEKWNKEKEKLREIFESAIRIKLKTLAGEWIYEVILPMSGEEYNTRFMTVTGPPPKVSLVQLVLAPGLRRYKQERRRLDSASFRPFGSEPQQDYDCIRKALVTCQ